MNQENFSPMKTWQKVVLGILAYSQVRRDFSAVNYQKKTGTRTNMVRTEIPNNGGL